MLWLLHSQHDGDDRLSCRFGLVLKFLISLTFLVLHDFDNLTSRIDRQADRNL
jgi:hypothetical protein